MTPAELDRLVAAVERHAMFGCPATARRDAPDCAPEVHRLAESVVSLLRVTEELKARIDA
jgi:hypothetical protein